MLVTRGQLSNQSFHSTFALQNSTIPQTSTPGTQDKHFPFSTGESSASIAHGNSNVESIKSLDPVNIKIGDRLHVLSGSDVTVDCMASGTPAPFIKWRRNGQPLKSGDAERQFKIRDITGGSQLKISQVSSDVQGHFECIATNLGGAERRVSSISVVGMCRQTLNFCCKRTL